MSDTTQEPVSGEGVHFHEVVTHLRDIDRGILKASAEKFGFYSVTSFLTFESRDKSGGNLRACLRFYAKDKSNADGDALYKFLSEHGFPDLKTKGWSKDDRGHWFGLEVRS